MRYEFVKGLLWLSRWPSSRVGFPTNEHIRAYCLFEEVGAVLRQEKRLLPQHLVHFQARYESIAEAGTIQETNQVPLLPLVLQCVCCRWYSLHGWDYSEIHWNSWQDSSLRQHPNKVSTGDIDMIQGIAVEHYVFKLLEAHLFLPRSCARYWLPSIVERYVLQDILPSWSGRCHRQTGQIIVIREKIETRVNSNHLA